MLTSNEVPRETLEDLADEIHREHLAKQRLPRSHKPRKRADETQRNQETEPCESN